MIVRVFVLSAFASVAFLFPGAVLADNMASLSIDPATGTVTLTPRWPVGGDLGGFHFMAQDLSLGGGATQFYSLKNTPIPPGGDPTAFTAYNAALGTATNHSDIGSKLTPNAYSGLTGADPDLGYGSVQFYFIHHKSDGDYLAHLVPGSGASSSVADLKPMSQPGGPSTGGASGYFSITFSEDDLGYGANLFYYLRTEPVSGFGILGSLEPALAGTATDLANLGIGGYSALASTTTDVGYGSNKFYYLRVDPVTDYTILGTINATTGRGEDIANLGSVFTTLTFVVGNVGFGTNNFYTTGPVNPTWQSVSFAAIEDRELLDGAFTVTPTASSGQPIVLSVVGGSTATATISGPVGSVFTVTPTSEGRLTLQATQMGQADLPAYEFNMLRQSFNVGPGPYLPPGVIPTEPGTTPDGPGSNLALLSDFNRDGNSDIVLRKNRSGTVYAMLMKGATVGARRVIARNVPVEKEIAAVGNFNGNGHSDILWRNRATGQLSIWTMRGTRMRDDREVRTRLPKSKAIAAAGDFNGDGRADILWRKPNGAVGVLLTRGRERFSNRNIGRSSTGDLPVGVGDFTKDGNVDILFQNSATSAVSLWTMNGTTFVSSSVLASSSDGWRIEGTGEFNADGHVDILLRNGKSIGVWLMNGDAAVGTSNLFNRPVKVKIQN